MLPFRWALLGLAVGACSPASLVLIDHETALRGKLIPDGDETVVTVEVDDEPVRVQSDHIERVQLPGQGLMLAGAGMMDAYLLIAVTTVAVSSQVCDPDDIYCDGPEGTGLVLGFAGPLASIGAIAFIWGLVLRRRAYRRIRGHRFGTATESELARALSVFGPEGLRFDLSL